MCSHGGGGIRGVELSLFVGSTPKCTRLGISRSGGGGVGGGAQVLPP